MSAIKKALSEIRFSIPDAILQEVFVDRTSHWRNSPQSLDDQIVSLVLRPRVLVDADLVGGTEIFVSLEGVPARMVDQFMTIYAIPKDRTQGRSIVSVKHLSYLAYGALASMSANQLFQPCSVTPLTSAAQAMFDSINSIPPISTARARLIGENTVLVQDTSPPVGVGMLRCTIGNEEELGNLPPRTYIDFADMCVLAVKAYIYNEYIIKLDLGFINGGQEIGRFKEIVDGYADANTMYREFLKTKWQKIAYGADREKMRRFIQLQTGGYR